MLNGHELPNKRNRILLILVIWVAHLFFSELQLLVRFLFLYVLRQRHAGDRMARFCLRCRVWALHRSILPLWPC